MTDLQHIIQTVGPRMALFFSFVAQRIGAEELAVELQELSKLVKDHRKKAKADPLQAKPNPREICALIIIEAWTLVHGKPPDAHNLHVQGICDTYRRACGSTAIAKRGDPEKWRRTISTVLEDSAMRQLIRDQLQRRVAQNRS